MNHTLRTNVAAELIAATTSHSKVGTHHLRAILNLCYPDDGSIPDINRLFADHVEGVLNMAKEYGWCMDVHDYLDAAWDQYGSHVDSQLFERAKVNDRWHWISSGMAYHDTHDAECDSSESHCSCGHQCDEHCRVMTYWWSQQGHRFIHADGREVSCLTCGARYTYTVDDSGMGTLVDAADCSHRTDMVHGIERACQADNGNDCEASRETGNCEHTDHECPCLFCR